MIMLNPDTIGSNLELYNDNNFQYFQKFNVVYPRIDRVLNRVINIIYLNEQDLLTFSKLVKIYALSFEGIKKNSYCKKGHPFNRNMQHIATRLKDLGITEDIPLKEKILYNYDLNTYYYRISGYYKKIHKHKFSLLDESFFRN